MESKPLLSLVMIVKNEAFFMPRTLESVRGIVDRILIVDTGSTDGTQDIVREALGSWAEGELVELPFVDYATTRNAALDLAEDKSEFVLMLSGDEALVGGAELRRFCEERLREEDNQGAFYLQMEFGDVRFDSARLTRCNGSRWRYQGVVHEVLVGPEGQTPQVRVAGASVFHDVSRRTHESMISTWKMHLRLLKAEHKRDPRHTRTLFYLAQTCESLGLREDALRFYHKRIKLGGWQEEVYEATFRSAKLKALLGKPWIEVQQDFLLAYQISGRAEPLYQIALYYHERDQHQLCVLFASQASRIPYPANTILFVDRSVYDWRAHELVAIHAYYCNQLGLGMMSAQRVAEVFPEDERIATNLRFYRSALRPQEDLPPEYSFERALAAGER